MGTLRGSPSPPAKGSRGQSPRSPARAMASEDLLGNALDRTLLRRIFGYVWPYRGRLLLAAALLPVVAVLEIAQPALLKRAIDEHIAVGRLAGLDRIGLLYLLALVGQYAAGFAQLYFTQVIGQLGMNDLRVRVHRHVMSLSASFFDRTPVGRLMTRMTNDIESLSEMFASGIVSLLGDAVRLVAILIAMFAMDWRLTLLSLGAAPVLFGIAAYFRTWVRDAFRDIRVRLARMNAFLQEHISGMKVVQAFAQEGKVARDFDVINVEYRRANSRAIAADAALYSIVEAVGAIAIAGLLWHGGSRIVVGTLTVGLVVAFIEYLGKFFTPIRDLSTKYTIMQQAMAAAERVFTLLDTKEPDAPAALRAQTLPPLPAQRGEGRGEGSLIDVRGISFAYRPEQQVLSDVTLSINTGETVAIVGATGAGKSTLVKLLPRLYDAQAGEIRIDGADIRTIDARALRKRIVVVSQDVFMFAGTLRWNIGLGDPAIDDARILSAARRVGADRVIASRAEGLDAPVLERGANFSAGERQLIAFARALAREPEILILDEATASVDPETERVIESGIAELMRGRTSIVIAHRLSTVRRASRIVVIHHGRIAEQGTHDALLAQGGIYARLYRLQMLGHGAPRRLDAAE
jgi:ATP-binding cassette, subfamily B, multidrug efflux pump